MSARGQRSRVSLDDSTIEAVAARMSGDDEVMHIGLRGPPFE